MQDTIAAIATAQGEGGIAIIRLSGDRAEAILKDCFVPARKLKAFESHHLYYGHIEQGGEMVDEAMAVMMCAPNSYTREDVAEIHCHGGRISAGRVMECVQRLGARLAEPGEFTKRAFLNGRIDLSCAEAVMQLIGADSEAAARASVRQMEGGVSAFVAGVCDRLTDVMALLEASTDFPEEVEEEAVSGEVSAAMRQLADDIYRRADGRSARILREGASIVLAGKPNVGKSSLMNALLARERAIVTEIPGTTRDVLTEKIMLGGIAAELSDTAGMRTADDPVEKIGVERAQRAVAGADIVIVVLDKSETLSGDDRQMLSAKDDRFILCLNKTDLPAALDEQALSLLEIPRFEISAKSGEGVDALAEYLAGKLAGIAGDGDGLTVQRHLSLARRAADALVRGAEGIEAGYVLDAAAVDLREALGLLGEITGQDVSESVIDRVFENFCVGK